MKSRTRNKANPYFRGVFLTIQLEAKFSNTEKKIPAKTKRKKLE